MEEGDEKETKTRESLDDKTLPTASTGKSLEQRKEG